MAILYYKDEYVKLINGDCLEIMQKIPDGKIDMILCDLPYGTTACKWDTIIPFEPLWEQYKRIIKDNGAIVLTASQPFTSALIMSNIEWFKYEWVWVKNRPSGFAQAKNKPMAKHENILVFSNGVTVHKAQSNKRMPYNPQGLKPLGKVVKNNSGKMDKDSVFARRKNAVESYTQEYTGYPDTVLNYDCETGYHPTQKPSKLFEYLIKTYTNEGDLVLDNCVGSGTTLIAAKNTNRKAVGIELEEKYCEIAKNRLLKASDTNGCKTTS